MTEKSAEVTELRNALAEIQRRLDEVEPQGSAPPKLLSAPDGGPVSDAHRWIKVSKTATVAVFRKSDGNRVVIEAEDFDPELHERGDAPREVLEDDEEEKVQNSFGNQTRAQLQKFSQKALRELPEYEALDEDARAAISDKDALVDAILAVRE